MKIDELDLRLLNILQRDSSMPLVKIAGSLHVTEGTVRNRIARLRRTGVIKKFTGSVDSAATGQAVVAFVLLNAAPGRLADVMASKIKAVSGVVGTQVITVLNAWKD